MPGEPAERVIESKLGRKLNSLEILLLVFVSNGQSSTYDLMVRAGMSPGLTGPALKRMKAAGLLTSNTGSRKVVRYALTKIGERTLRGSLQSANAENWWLEESTFYENWPRSLFLIWLSEGFHKAEEWFERAEEQIQVLRDKKQNEAKGLEEEFLRIKKRYKEDPSSYDKGFILAHAYRAMKVASEAAALTTQAERIGINAPLLWALEDMQLFQNTDSAPDLINNRKEANKPKLNPSSASRT